MVHFRNEELAQLMQGFAFFKGVKGSIVRLYVKNFMTYRSVELKAGPNVNLVMGPNGTGKSTIVCAICLGLAGKPKILGRAHALKEYIRHGATQATIEIELYNPAGSNYIIKRVITESSKGGATSAWFVNKKSSRSEDVEHLMSSLNIQLDNLCQFLPQDRVQEFAKQDTVTRLKSTEMAIGNDTLAAQHDKLIEFNAAISKLESTLKRTGESLKIELQHNQRLENEVQAFQQRQQIKNKIDSLLGKKAWIAYQQALDRFSEVKEQEKRLREQKANEERSIAPLKKCVERLDSCLGKFREEVNKLRSSTSARTLATNRRYQAEKEQSDTACNDVAVQVEQAEKTEKEREARLDQYIKKIESIERELAELEDNGEFNAELIQSQLTEYNAKKTEVNRQIIEINILDEQDEDSRRELRRKIDTSQNELRRMENMRDSRMAYLDRFEPHVSKMVKHFEKEENLSRFKGAIHEPMILHVSVNDLVYGNVAEKHIPRSDLTAFFCENKDDLYHVSEMGKQMGARISVIHHVCPPGFRKPTPTVPRDVLAKYQFKKVLSELIEAPDYYMSYIIRSFSPQHIPIGVKATDDMLQEIMDRTDIGAYYTETFAYYIRKSLYSGQKFSQVAYLATAKIFTNKINAAEQDKIRETIKNAQSESAKYEQAIQKRNTGLRKLEEEKRGLDKMITECRAKIDNKKRLEARIGTLQKSVANLEKEQVDLASLQARSVKESNLHRMKQLKCIETCTSTFTQLSMDGLMLLVVKRKQSVLQSRVITKQSEYEEAKTNINEFNQRIQALAGTVKAAADHSAQLKNEAKELTKMEQPPDDVRRGEIDLEEVDRELSSANVQLGFLADTNPSIIRAYEDRRKRIVEMEKSRVEKEAELVSLAARLQETKDEWLGPLSDLVDRINDNFSRFFASMNCAGQVSLDHGEDENDFSKYGITIKVKFRAAEQLTELSGWKQSGGERAITTALYVLALQELTTVPFRVIDEINQGMDAQNEARFFNLLCSLANGDNTPQYFLLTPKMLPQVEYPDNVEFHFIFSGPHVYLKNYMDANGIQGPELSDEDDDDDDEDIDSDD